MRRPLPVDGLLDIRVPLGIQDHAVLVQHGFRSSLILHQGVHSQEGKIRLREILRVGYLSFLPAERAGDDRAVPELEDTFLTEGVPTLT